MAKDDAMKPNATPLGSVTLAKAPPPGSVVPVPESEIGTEADIDVGDGGVPPIGPHDDIKLNLEGSAPTVAADEPSTPSVDFRSALPLYRISGSGDAPAPKPRAASATRPPSGDLPKGLGASIPPREGQASVVSVRRETVWTRLAEKKWMVLAAAAAVAVALLVVLLRQSSDSAREKAAEAERIQKLSGQK